MKGSVFENKFYTIESNIREMLFIVNNWYMYVYIHIDK